VPKIDTFYSIEEPSKPREARVCHSTDNPCETGRKIPLDMRKAGSGGYANCPDCAQDWVRADK